MFSGDDYMVTIKTRAQWGARPPKKRATITTPVRENWLHHTAGSEAGAAGMRRIQNQHMDDQDWYDIGYSWVYDRDERTWYEGRGWGVSGSHTYGHNSISHGFCVMGNFQNENVTREIIYDIAWMVAEGYRRGMGPAKLTGGHRDTGSTACPGDNLYNAIPLINNKIAEILGGKGETWPTSILRNGSSGPDVYFLQSKLNETGWVNIAVDGKFGDNTETAVRKVQTNLKITSDGVVGPNTWGALQAHLAPAPTPEPEPDPQPESTGDWAYPEHANNLLAAGIYSKWTGPGANVDTDNLSAYVDRAIRAGAGLVRIGTAPAVLHVVGEYLVPVTDAEQAKLLVKTAGGNPDKWQQYVTSITQEEADNFTRLKSGELVDSTAHNHDKRYAMLSHTHPVADHDHPADDHTHTLTFNID